MRKPRKPRVQRRRVYLCVSDPGEYIGSDEWADNKSLAIRRAVEGKYGDVIRNVCGQVPHWKVGDRVKSTLVEQYWNLMRKSGWTLLRGRLSFVIPRKRGT